MGVETLGIIIDRHPKGSSRKIESVPILINYLRLKGETNE
jgi:hypothetical protein